MAYLYAFDERYLVRVHPRGGGVRANMGGQAFQGASPDIFFGLDTCDPSTVRVITRKFNLNIDVDPEVLPAEALFRLLTCGLSGTDPFVSRALQPTRKCKIHGDEATGLRAHPTLQRLLDVSNLNKVNATTLSFMVNGVYYEYDSVGVAANPDYHYVKGRPTNHLEIKFRAVSATSHTPEEYLCLNVHLHAQKHSGLGLTNMLTRLTAAIQLFYAELGVLNLNVAYIPQTAFFNTLNISLNNFTSNRFECHNQLSRTALQNHRTAKASSSANASAGSASENILNTLFKKALQERQTTPEVAATSRSGIPGRYSHNFR